MIRSTYSTTASVVKALLITPSSILGAFDVVAAPSGVAVVLVTVIATTLAMLWAIRVRLTLDPKGVTIVNYWGSKRLSWEEIDEISAASAWFFFSDVVTFHGGANVDVLGVPLKPSVSANATILFGRRSDRQQLLNLLREYARQHTVRFSLDLDQHGSWVSTSAA